VSEFPGPAHLRATLAQVASPDLLASAWADVLASDRDDEVPGAGVARFAQDAEDHLAEIGAQLESGSYAPGRLTPVALPRPDGQTRMLHIPAARDRIVERAIAQPLTHELQQLGQLRRITGLQAHTTYPHGPPP
jgi:retron-type reverse transcriptase